MGLSAARANSTLTAQAYKLVAATSVALLDTGNYEVVGECGHRLLVVRPHEKAAWEGRIEAKRRHRKRCEDCIKDPEAHAGRLFWAR